MNTTLMSWSGRWSAASEIITPRDTDELVAMVRRARDQRRRIVVRGAGLSFDDQALGNDLALDMTRFDHLDVPASTDGPASPPPDYFEAGAGVRWGNIFAALAPRGAIVPSMVSTSLATVGGTLASHAMSRFSPIYGKEGKHITSFEIVLADGTVHKVDRDSDPDLFHAVISGWGGLGVVTRATYRTTPIPLASRVYATIDQVYDEHALERVAESLIPSTANETVYGAGWGRAKTRTQQEFRAMIVRARYEPGPVRSMLPHRPHSPMRIPIEWLINRSPLLGDIFWHFTTDLYMPVLARKAFRDSLDGFTFFTDGHVAAQRAAHGMSLPFALQQQTFIVPSEDRSLFGRFMRHIIARFSAESLPISLIDFLWLPADSPFCLSSTAAGAGWALTFSFGGGSDPARLARAMVDLAEDTASVGGRIHLVKNVYATPGSLARMYAPGLARLAKVKRRVDPDDTFGSLFLDRCFPSVFGRHA